MYIMYIFFWYSCTHTISVRNDRISATPEVKIGKILIDQVGKDRWGTLSESLGDVERWSGLKTFFFSKMMSLIDFGWSLKSRKQQETGSCKNSYQIQLGKNKSGGLCTLSDLVFLRLPCRFFPCGIFFSNIIQPIFWSRFRIFPHMRNLRSSQCP